MKQSFYKIFLVSFLLCIFSCHNKENQYELEDVIKNWIGKELLIPTESIDTIIFNDSILIPKHAKFEILMYVDSTSCTTCNIDFYLWNELIKKANYNTPDRFKFTFYCQPKRNGKSSIINFAKKDHFAYPIFIDSLNTIGELNNIKNDFNVQCFLLDSTHHVVALGDPTKNAKLWKYYQNLSL